MKTILAAALLACALASPAFADCTTTNACVFPPGPCAYLGFDELTFANGWVLNYLDFENSVDCGALPPVGGSTNQLIHATCVLRLANGGPGTFAAGNALMNVDLFGAPGANPREFDIELLALDLSGLTLPGGALLRESPSHPSPGHASALEGPPGTFLFHSFFDVFFELSLDNGQTWSPSLSGQHVDLSPSAPLPARPSTWGAVKATYR